MLIDFQNFSMDRLIAKFATHYISNHVLTVSLYTTA